MSSRTAQANKAVALAWINEQELVNRGQGTRDWTPDQQKAILERGRAYDEDGKAFQGHHMKNVENYPEHQGNPQNIQFLTRTEHQAAHLGNFQNSTNDYFDPLTGITKEFGLDELEPCKVIKLSAPVVNISIPSQKDVTDMHEGNNAKEQINDSEEKIYHQSESSEDTYRRLAAQEAAYNAQFKNRAPSISERLFDRFIRRPYQFYKRHEDIIKPIAKGIGLVAAGIGLGVSASNHGNKSSHQEISPSYQEDDDDYDVDEENVDEDDETTEANDNRIERTSPREHTVSGHKQRYNGVWKEKAPYPRGGNKH